MNSLSKIGFSPHDAAFLGNRCAELSQGALELAGFNEGDPELAAATGVEVAALEARSILATGAVQRVQEASLGASKKGQPVQIAEADVNMVHRLEAVLASSSNRIAQKVAVLAAAEERAGVEKLGAMIGLATGAVGLIKTIF